MNCQNCGQPLSEGAAFCGNCGVQAPQQNPQPTTDVAVSPAVPQNNVAAPYGAQVGIEQTTPLAPMEQAQQVSDPQQNTPVQPTETSLHASPNTADTTASPAPSPAAAASPPYVSNPQPLAAATMQSSLLSVPEDIKKSQKLVSILGMVYAGINVLGLVYLFYAATIHSSDVAAVGSELAEEDVSAIYAGILIATALVGVLLYFVLKLYGAKNINEVKKQNKGVMILSGVIIALLVLEGQPAGVLTIILMGLSINLHMKVSKISSSI